MDQPTSSDSATSEERVLWRLTLSTLIFLGVAGVVLFLAFADEPSRHEFVGLVGVLAWPLMATIAVVVFRDPVAKFLEGLAPRLTKISAFKIELELKAASTLSHWSPAALSELQKASSAPTNDSSGHLMASFADATPCDYVEVDLGDGDEWLTSRLFILAAQMERLRGLRCIVFLENSGGIRRRFAGMVTPSTLRWAFAMRWPWLEEAYANAYHSVIDSGGPPLWGGQGQVLPARIVSTRGALSGAAAQEVFRRYLRGVNYSAASSNSIRISAPMPPNPDREWVDLGQSKPQYGGPPNREWERAEWVTAQTLQVTLGADFSHACVMDSLEATPEKLARAVLQQSSPFVARLRHDSSFDTIVDRIELALTVARNIERP